jgi:hypothetical protein
MRFSTVQVLIPIKWWLRQLLFGLHLFSLKCCAYFLPGSYGNEHRYPNPETVCANEICPEVEWTDPEVEAIQVCGDKVNQASVELTQTNGELENMAEGLLGCNSIAASRKKLVRQSKSYIMNPNSVFKSSIVAWAETSQLTAASHRSSPRTD